MSYRKVSSGWIKGRVGRALRGDADAYTLAYYLMTAEENVKGLGLFWQPLPMAGILYGLPIDRLSIAYETLSRLGFARYSTESEIHFVTESARHEWGEAPNLNSRAVQGMQPTLFEQLDMARNSSLFRRWLDRYGETWAHILQPLEERGDRLSIAYRAAIDTPEPSPDPDPSPEPEPEDHTERGSAPAPGGATKGGDANENLRSVRQSDLQGDTGDLRRPGRDVTHSAQPGGGDGEGEPGACPGCGERGWPGRHDCPECNGAGGPGGLDKRGRNVTSATEGDGESAPKGSGEPRKPTDAQRISDLLGKLFALGVAGATDMWKERLRCTVASKRPNRARQIHQLKKVLKGITDGPWTSGDGMAILRLAAERGWSGIEWRYLAADRERNGRDPRTGDFLPCSSSPQSFKAQDHARDLARLHAPAMGDDEGEIDIDARLRRLAEAAPAARDDILALAGNGRDPEAIQLELEVIDREMLKKQKAALSGGDHREILGKVKSSVAALPSLDMMTESDVKKARRRIGWQVLREHARLPVLSLFGAEAAG